jgi:hypothetical protein
MILQGLKRYQVKTVMLHTSATPGNWWKNKSVEDMRDEVRRWHVEDNKWRDIGYHRLFAPSGEMAQGRSLYEIGAGAGGYNRGFIHICMVPIATIKRMGKPLDFYTEKQIRAVKSYIGKIEHLAGHKMHVMGHNEVAAKLCPGFKVVSSDWA